MLLQMLFEDAQRLGNVLLYCFFGDVELFADLFIGKTLAAQREDFVAFGGK